MCYTKKAAEQMLTGLSCPCCGELACTHRRWLLKRMKQIYSEMEQQKSDGEEPKQKNNSSHTCREMRLEFSEDASPQDLYLIIRGLCEGGFNVSVNVQATPASPPSPYDILEQFTCLTSDDQFTVSLAVLAALGQCLSDIMQSSRTPER